MGGIGSGDWFRSNGKTTVESQYAIDIRYLKKHGYLKQGKSGTFSWSNKGEQSGAIGFLTEEHGLRLNFRSRMRGDDWEDVEQFIAFDYSPCHYGGKRIWLSCPNCFSRVTCVYGGEEHFWCRQCYELNYQSQHEDYFDRQISKAHEIRKNLGGEPGLSSPFPDKPKGMHWKTYWKLHQQARHGEQCFIQKAQKYLGYLP